MLPEQSDAWDQGVDQDANNFGSHFIKIHHKMSHQWGFILGLCRGCRMHSVNMMQSGLSLKIISVIPYKYSTQFVTTVAQGQWRNYQQHEQVQRVPCYHQTRRGEKRGLEAMGGSLSHACILDGWWGIILQSGVHLQGLELSGDDLFTPC